MSPSVSTKEHQFAATSCSKESVDALQRKRLQNRLAQRRHRIKVQNRLRSLEEKLRISIESDPDSLKERNTQAGQSRPSSTPGASNDSLEYIEMRIPGVPNEANNSSSLPTSITEELPVPGYCSNESRCENDFISEDFALNIFSPLGRAYTYDPPSYTAAYQKTHQRSMLHVAVERGYSTIVEILLKKGARVSAQDDTGMTSLHLAAQQGHDDIAKMLLDWHADPNLLDFGGKSPLHYAVDGNCKKALNVLLASGADVNLQNAEGQIALHLAAGRGNNEILTRLLQQDPSSIATRDHLGATAMSIAVTKGYAATVSTLLDHGEDPNSAIGDESYLVASC